MYTAVNMTAYDVDLNQFVIVVSQCTVSNCPGFAVISANSTCTEPWSEDIKLLRDELEHHFGSLPVVDITVNPRIYP